MYSRDDRPIVRYMCPPILFSPLYREPGTAEGVVAELFRADPEAAKLARAFLMYYRGDSCGAAKLAGELLEAGCRFETLLGASNVLSLEALFMGDAKKWDAAREIMAKSDYASDRELALKELNLGALDGALFVKATFPQWFCEGCFDPLPEECFSTARYLYAKLLFMQSRFSELAVVVEPFISQSRAEKALMSEVYLRIIAAMGKYCVGDCDRAAIHVRRALELALPDGIITPFAEYRRHLGSILDDTLKGMDASALKTVIEMNETVIEGWTKLYNALYNKKYTNDLTAREYDTARFALLGLTNGEIADKMNISVNTVKLYLRNIYEKLGVNKRDELAPYIWDEP